MFTYFGKIFPTGKIKFNEVDDEKDDDCVMIGML